ncbi:MAG TPA: tripartite tricarboxylate transporter substrate binding protein [Noviherbaspirillum sp.]|jgi:tripartite-type tricarboxylate transporter receptor subunit TctC|uniref:Bug family tripartite tricarboxylate transporter substrate binding protein n=1 Tax=Noviherbaspirillum sp. TaxID=1926288 RepID=UPI002F94B69F
MKRCLFLSLAFAAASMCGTASAAGYPDKPIRLVVPYAAGGSTDLTARLLAKSMTARFGQPVIVDNRAGAGGSIGHETVAKSTPDGYTLLFSAAGPLTVTPHTYPKLSYEPVKSFAPIMLVATQPLLLVVNPAMKVNSVADLIKEAKARQGKLNYGSFGNGSAAHLAAESFKMLTKAEMMHVPYKGSSPALAGLVGGEIDLMFDVFSTAAPLAESGKLRPIAITSRERSPLFPSVPTMDEAGVAGMDAGTWFGILAPAGTPQEIIDQVNRAANAALGEQELRSTLASQGAAVRGGTPAQFADFFNSEFQKMGTLVKAVGVKVD